MGFTPEYKRNEIIFYIFENASFFLFECELSYLRYHIEASKKPEKSVRNPSSRKYLKKPPLPRRYL
jgi:hypothetical protein